MARATDRERVTAKRVAEAVVEFLIAWDEGRRVRTPEPARPHLEVKLPEPPPAPALSPYQQANENRRSPILPNWLAWTRWLSFLSAHPGMSIGFPTLGGCRAPGRPEASCGVRSPKSESGLPLSHGNWSNSAARDPLFEIRETRCRGRGCAVCP